MSRLLLSAVVALSLFACGPDAVAQVDGVEEDMVEVAEGELTTSSRATTWLPLQAGNEWVFKSTTTSATKTVRVLEFGDDMALVSGLFAEPTWVGLSSGTSTTLLRWHQSRWENFIRFGYAVTTWKTSTTVCTGLVGKRAATGTVITTPAGSFSDTRTIAFAQNLDPATLCAPPAFNELSFVPNVGLVAFRTGRGERFTLQRATVNGQAFPAATSGAVETKLTLDQASYVSYPNTIQCITTPCPSNAQTAEARVTFEVKNVSTNARTWSFSSGCQFDVELVTSTGRIVRKLSEGRACTMALTSVTLSPGQLRTFTATLPLADRDGLQLDGTYTVRAKLLPSTGASTAPSATKSLRVDVLVP